MRFVTSPPATTAKRPPRPCAECGTITTSQDRLCRPCKPLPIAAPTYADGLRGGSWVRRNGIAVWVPSPRKVA
jgi:hypothetical protein